MNGRLLWKSSPVMEWLQSYDEGKDVESLRAVCEETEKHEFASDPVFGEVAAQWKGAWEGRAVEWRAPIRGTIHTIVYENNCVKIDDLVRETAAAWRT